MERQVFLAVKGKHCNSKKVDKELSNISKMLPYIESFRAFRDNNEVFDVFKRTVIKNNKWLFNFYGHGTDSSEFIFVICKN